MKKRSVSKTAKTKASSPKKRTSRSGLYATEHDFIIIAGGGLVVLMLTVFLFILS